VIEEHYKKMIISKDNPLIDRNLLVHGDYYNDKMDITARDVVKLILLFINIRYISSFVQKYLDMIKQIIIYGVSYHYQELKKTTK
jgi:aspartyl/asparaginyl beta-hydroxylase (cupin superfamily)